MAKKVNIEHQVKIEIMKHLSLRRKGNVVQLIWTELGEGDDTWTTIFSEANIRDIQNQIVGNVYDGRTK